MQANCSGPDNRRGWKSLARCGQLTTAEGNPLSALRGGRDAPNQSATSQHFQEKCFQNSNVFKGSPSAELFGVALVLRISTRTHGLSPSGWNGTVPDRKVSAGQTVPAPPRGCAHRTGPPQSERAKRETGRGVCCVISRTRLAAAGAVCA